jgi:hypothetical protein
MAYNSPLADPGPYITKVNELSAEGITIDKGVDGARREAAEFATKYGADFTIVVELQESIDKFSAVCFFIPILISHRISSNEI